MMRYLSRLTIVNVNCLAAALSLIVMTGAATLAQVGPGDAGAPAAPNPRIEAQQRQNREWQLRSPELKAAMQGVNQKRVQAAVELVKNDFKRIQVIRNEMVDNLVAKKPFDFKLISEQSGEIHKRSQRLKTFLMPPVTEEAEKEPKSSEPKNQVEYRNEEMKGALVKLCNLIFTFTENPVLKTPDVVDVQQSAKAGRDLLSIIELSDNIKRSAERLRKETK